MNISKLLIIIVILAGTNFQLKAQGGKIGYTNIELVLAYMPETKNLEQQLTTFQKKLAEQLQVKEKYMQTKYQEYLTKKERNEFSQESEKEAENELTNLDSEVRKLATESEQRILSKRQELLGPILEKLQKAIDETAQENGFEYILNQTTSTGVSTILYGPDNNDITKKLMTKLGIPIPE